MNLSFQLLKSIFYCRNVNNNNGNQGFKPQISCLIEERVDNCVHAFRSVFTIENHAGQKTEEESSGNTYKVTCGKTVLFVCSETGQSESTVSQYVVQGNLRRVKNVTSKYYVEQTQGYACNQALCRAAIITAEWQPAY